MSPAVAQPSVKQIWLSPTTGGINDDSDTTVHNLVNIVFIFRKYTYVPFSSDSFIVQECGRQNNGIPHKDSLT